MARKTATAPEGHAGEGPRRHRGYLRLINIIVILWLFPHGIGLAESAGGRQAAAPILQASSFASAQADSRLAEYFLGVTLYRSERWDQAATVLEALVEKNPEFSLAAGAVADAYRKLQQADKAQMYYAMAAQLCQKKLDLRAGWGMDTETVSVKADLIYYLYRLGQRDEAWKLLESLDPESREDLAGLAAMLLFARGETKRARREISRGLNKDPLNPRLLEFVIEAKEAGLQLGLPEKKPHEEAGRVYALLIGIGQYQDRRIARLSYLLNDAICIDRALRNPRYGLFDSEDVVVLLDQQATVSSIKRELHSLETKARAQDIVIIYYAGGAACEGKDTYWIVHDTELERIPDTSLNNSLIAESLTRIPARRLAVFVDSFHTGSALPAESGSPKNLNDYVSVGNNRAIVFITASTGEQVSREMKGAEHGAFSRQLCEVLRGNGDDDGDGLIDIEEAWSYVSNSLGPAAGGNQVLHVREGSRRYTKGFAIARNPLIK